MLDGFLCHSKLQFLPQICLALICLHSSVLPYHAFNLIVTTIELNPTSRINILIFVYLFSYLFFFRRGEGVSGSEKVRVFFFFGGGGGYVDFCDIFVGVFSVEKKKKFL